MLDDVEDFLEWPILVEQAEKEVAFAGNLVITDKNANAEDRPIFRLIAQETREAIERRDPHLLEGRLAALSAMIGDIVRRDPDYVTHRLILGPTHSAIDGSMEIYGRVMVPDGLSPLGLRVKFTNVDTQPEWNSGPIPLGLDGAFSLMARIHPDEATNEFHVALQSGERSQLKITPDYVVLRIRKAEKLALEAE